MNLGNTILRLRTERNLSQEELASALGVSRQSISKWETNGSTPELEKLIKLSEVFGVSLDELVLDKKIEASAEPPPSPSPTEPASRFPVRKIVGTILLCFGGLFFFLLLLLGGDFLGGLVFSSPFLLCGAICLIFSKNLGLWCTWAVFFTVNVYLRWATGVNWRLTLMTFRYEPHMNYVRLIMAWVELVIMVLLPVITILRFRKKTVEKNKKNLWMLAAGWIVFILLRWLPTGSDPFAVFPFWILKDWIRLAILVPVITQTVRCFFPKKA